MSTASSPSAFVCEAECDTYSDDCPFCIMERLACTETVAERTDSDVLHASIAKAVAEGGFDPELKERPGSIGIEFQGANRSRRKAQWVAQFWSAKLGFPLPVKVGAFATKEAAAEAYDVACLAMGMPARNYPDRPHTEAAIAPVRAHLEARRKTV